MADFRIEDWITNEESIAGGSSSSGAEQTLIDPTVWHQVNRGSPSSSYPEGWRSLNGGVDENSIELQEMPEGDLGLVWGCHPDNISSADGGFNHGGGYVPIDPKYTTRLTIGIKKRGSPSGHSYVGMHTRNSAGSRLSITPKNVNGSIGAATGNFYNESRILPDDDKWYIFIGYLMPSEREGPTLSGIFEYGTGVRVQQGIDGIMHPDTYDFSLRAYLFYCTNIDTRQYMTPPRIEKMDGRQKSMNEILGI